ncbi:methyl-accepting chemotaxis protein [Falsibacillus pallidus]|uniref:methyl-accepting chemotaxis protein n=1 Tax=Falsibacillus pallidus TaxID=493781 RepID=UPI003D9809C8
MKFRMKRVLEWNGKEKKKWDTNWNLRSWKNNTTIKGKIFTVFGFMASCFVLTIGLVFFFFHGIYQDMKDIKSQGSYTAKITEIGKTMNEKDIRIADYITFLKEKDLSDYRSLRNKVNVELKKLMEHNHDKKQLSVMQKIEKNNASMNKLFVNDVAPAVVRLDKNTYTKARESISSLRNQNNLLLEQLVSLANQDQQEIIKASQIHKNYFQFILLAAALFVIAISGIVVWLVTQSIRKRLGQLVLIADRAAKGDLQASEEGNGPFEGKEEIQVLSRSVHQMMEDLRNLVSAIKKMAENMAKQSTSIKSFTEHLNHSSEEISSSMIQLSASADTQWSETHSMLHQYDEFNEQIQEVRGNGQSLDTSSKSAISLTREGYELMNETVQQIQNVHSAMEQSQENMQSMNENVEGISKFIELISSISSQTNLLALNAAIEAARAGESGKGFAVVANEVRKLAAQVDDSLTHMTHYVSSVKDAAKRVQDSIESGYERLEEGAASVSATGESFSRIKDEIEGMAESISSISQSIFHVSDKGKSIKRAFQSMSDISQHFQSGSNQASSAVQEQNSMLEHLFSEAENMQQNAQELTRLVQNFS